MQFFPYSVHSVFPIDSTENCNWFFTCSSFLANVMAVYVVCDTFKRVCYYTIALLKHIVRIFSLSLYRGSFFRFNRKLQLVLYLFFPPIKCYSVYVVLDKFKLVEEFCNPIAHNDSTLHTKKHDVTHDVTHH